MKKFLICLVFCYFLFSISLFAATWTGKILTVTKNVDGLTLTLVYSVTDGITIEQFTEPKVPSAESLVQVVQNAVNYKNKVQTQKDKITALNTSTLIGDLTVVTKVVFPDHIPTQDEIDLAAFILLVSNYKNAVAEVKGGVGKTTQADVDALVVQIKATYKDAYAPLIVGLF